ncbi:MAG: helix-turn-helix domain-containing protein [Lachnospiraceae bacterium]|nr:helix-turn-helix domain-containing protein [Lachnospiraceae bacterium]
MDKISFNPKFIADRITRIRIEHNISEYQLSLDLGFSKGYIQAISSGNIVPSLGALYKICDYFDITPAQFFAGNTSDSKLVEDLARAIREMSTEEQYTLYHFLKGGKLPAQEETSPSNPESQAPRLPESDK